MTKRKRRPPRMPAPPAANGHEREYQHVEAFCLMKYRCKLCKTVEILWNSRDGVTPFIILCRFCRRGESVHIDWSSDLRVVDYIPTPGQRVFVDMPESLKAPLARERVVQFKGTQYEAKSETEAEARVKGIIDSFKEGAPWIIQWHS